MTAPVAIQSVRDLLRERWGVPLSTAIRDVPTTAVGLVPVTVLKQDATRIGFLLVNLGGGILFVLPSVSSLGPPSSTQGIRVEANGGNLAVNWEEDGEVVAWEWRAVASAATTILILPVHLDQGREA